MCRQKHVDAAAKQLNIEVELLTMTISIATLKTAGTLVVEHIPLVSPVMPGHLDSSNSHYVLETLKRASLAA